MEEDYEEEETTAAEIFKMLTNAWSNEKNCPDLLKNRIDLVDCMMDQLKQMEENLKSLSLDDFVVVPHRMEVDRIRYVISSYLRTRLQKIESYTVFLLKRDREIPFEEDRFMTKAEFAFAEQYSANLGAHFEGEAFKYMPSLLYEFVDIGDVEVRPNMKSIVVFKMLKNIKGILVNGSSVNLTEKACHVFPFNNVKMFIDDGSAVCI